MASRITETEQGITDFPSKARVLLCIDGSREAENAFKFYRDILHREDYEVILFHVSECVNVHSGFVIANGNLNEEAITESMRKIHLENMKLTNQFSEMAKDAKLKFQLYTVSGETGPGRAVINAIKEHNISFVVLGSRGLGKIRRTVLGSVSEYVLHHSDIPVFICPPKIPPAYYDMISDVH